MTNIIDKRKLGKNRSVDNRRRFIDRYKGHIKKSVDQIADGDTVISDIEKNKTVKIPTKDLSEPTYSFDYDTGRSKRVFIGNKSYGVGDTIYKQPGSTRRGGSNSGEGEDEFSFVLTKDEFIDIYFSDLELPDFIKKSLKDTTTYKLCRAGFTKEGIPPRLDILKTFKQSIARRVATGSERFLDDVDMRYRHYVHKPVPVLHARVFFLMDVSGSMGDHEKTIAKKFFLLFYLFLTKEYKSVEVTFVRHTTDAKVVDEKEFFYSRESGGTMVSAGLGLINQIIKDEVDLGSTNVYVAQASDGDDYYEDKEDCIEELESLLTKVQYFAYIQTVQEGWGSDEDDEDVYDWYEDVSERFNNLKAIVVQNMDDVYPALRYLFKKE